MNKFIKTAASLAIIATFGIANAQQEEKKQIQNPSSGFQPAPMSKASGPKVDDAVKQKQEPSSGMQPTTGKASTGPKVDDTVKQTQKPGEAPPEVVNTGRKLGTKNQSMPTKAPVEKK